jgi:hypothetical protein
LALWISNAFKLLADPSTHAPDFPVAVCREALHFVHARLWCKDVLDVMGSGSGSSDSSSNSGGSRTEKRFQAIWKFYASCVARIHCDEDSCS